MSLFAAIIADGDQHDTDRGSSGSVGRQSSIRSRIRAQRAPPKKLIAGSQEQARARSATQSLDYKRKRRQELADELSDTLFSIYGGHPLPTDLVGLIAEYSQISLAWTSRIHGSLDAFCQPAEFSGGPTCRLVELNPIIQEGAVYELLFENRSIWMPQRGITTTWSVLLKPAKFTTSSRPCISRLTDTNDVRGLQVSLVRYPGGTGCLRASYRPTSGSRDRLPTLSIDVPNVDVGSELELLLNLRSGLVTLRIPTASPAIQATLLIEPLSFDVHILPPSVPDRMALVNFLHVG